MGNGIYDYSTTTEVTTGNANVPIALLNRTIAAGGVNDGNCLRLRCEFKGSGSAAFMLNNINLFVDPWTINGNDHIVEVEIWRIGRYAALVRIWNGAGGGNTALVPGGRFSVTGLDWQSGQALVVNGESTIANGLILSRVGVMK